MTIYSGDSDRDLTAFRVRASRGTLRKLYRSVYTDDFDRPAEAIVAENLLAIASVLLPDWQLSHRSAAVRGPVEGLLFMSGPGKPGRHLDLAGVRIIRLPELSAPEHDWIPAPTAVVRGVDRPPEVPFIRVSTPLQTIFECLGTARAYPQKTLPEPAIVQLIRRLSLEDRERAEPWAARNGLEREYRRYAELSRAVAAARRVPLPEPERTDIHFYGWRVGTLTHVEGGAHGFAYDAAWPVPLSSELPLTDADVLSYDRPRLPAFFDNCLPEGWNESTILSSNSLSRVDSFGLLTSARKYPSNLTLRPLGLPDPQLVYDAHTVRLTQLRAGADGPALHLREDLEAAPEHPSLWHRDRPGGLVRFCGAQAKLPVSLVQEGGGARVRLGDLRHACTHILKLSIDQPPGHNENEWASLELARRIGLPVADAALVEFQEGSAYGGRLLLVERYDIPNRDVLESPTDDARLMLQEDACSLLLLRREDKYRTSMEQVADALLAAGVDRDGEDGMRRFLHLVMFSWLIGNGDLHAKNVSILRGFRTGRPGEAPVPGPVRLAPLYDLVNTRVYTPRDDFAVPVDGRTRDLRLGNFIALASRWDMPAARVRDDLEWTRSAVDAELDGVLAESGLSGELQDRYAVVVRERVSAVA